MNRFFIAATASLVLCLPTFGEETAVSLATQYDTPRVGPSVAARNLTFESGHLKINLVDGSAAPVMAGSETLGVFFKGSGNFEYLSVDPAEAAVMVSNVRNSTKLKTEKNEKGIVVRDTFDEVFLWVAGRDFPKPSGDAGASHGEAAASMEQAFAAHRETFSHDNRADAAFLFIQQKLDAPTTPVVRAQFRGGAETMVYVYDPLVTRSETLFSLYKMLKRDTTIREFQDALWPVTLSEQLIGQTRKQPVEPAFFLLDLTYTLTASEKSDATLNVVETILPHKRAQRVYRFDQYNTDYDTNDRLHRFTVRAVTDESGKSLSFVHRKDELLVSLPQAAPANKPFKIKFEIDGDFLIRPSGDSYWQLGAGDSWFPQPLQNGQFYTIHSTVKVKKPFVPFAPGETVSRREEGDYNVVENKIDKPVRFAVVQAGKYSYEEETRNGLTIRVATYAGKNARATKQLTNLAFTMIQFFEPFLGPFPFKEFNIIEINEFGYGQAPPGTMFITQEAFNPTIETINQVFSRGINHRFAHEIAHQYWGNAVKMASDEEQWVNESFAEYTASLLIREGKGKGEYKLMENTWKANANDAKALSSIATAHRLKDVGNENDAFWDRTHLIYDKGAFVLSALHQEIGDKMFLSFLRNFQARFAWKLATTQDMIMILQQLTQKDYTEFFERNVSGTGMPQG
jgi:hypothetical protein